jgi:hypothetical protein
MAPGKYPSFHMASYLLDMMCLVHAYPEMGWAWKPTELPIHVYCKVLWEHKYHTKYQKICEKFLFPYFSYCSAHPHPSYSEKDQTIVGRIGIGVLKYDTYIICYSAMKSPHLLPKFVLDILVLQEIAYQTMIHGVGVALNRDKKLIWPPLPLWVGSYSFKDIKESQEEMDTLNYFTFGEERFHRHDPQKVINTHYHNCKYRWSYE